MRRRQKPRSFAALFEAAGTSQRSGRTLESIQYYERAIRVDGNVAEAHYNLGGAFIELGRFGDAEGALRRALSIRADYPEAFHALGRAVAELGRLDEAVPLFERALALNGGSASAYVWLGAVLLQLQRFPEAQTAFTEARTLAPGSAEVHDGVGVALQRVGRTDDAIASFRTALSCDPAYANAACNLGQALIETGELAEAQTWLARAIELDPGNGRFFFPLVAGGAARLAPEHLRAMMQLGESIESLPHESRLSLHFALAQVDEAAGRTDAAFHHLLAGNALKRADTPYDERAALAFLQSTEASFGNPVMEHVRGCGDPSNRPVFVFGMPRSGSTLVEQLLAAHPQVAAAGEIGLLERIVREIWPTISATTLAGLRDDICKIGVRYLLETDGLAASATRLVDKSLSNFQLAPLIHVMLPEARMIHIRRDPLDTCFSCFATLFRDHDLPFSYELGQLGRYYRAYAQMMERWTAFIAPDRLLEVSYERLVENFEDEARRIVAFCGLPWDAASLAFHEVRRPVRTASTFQVRQPLYRSALGRARRFITHLGPLIEALNGYTLGIRRE